MDMVKVDPKLFVTCRLCLEQMGMYQVTPSVRDQFKYCFDIDVDPFDGLPQLICSGCQTVLCDYSTKKRIYIGRQNAIKAQLQVRREIESSVDPNLQQQNTVSSSHQNDNGNLDDDKQKYVYAEKKKSRQKSIASLSADNTRSRSTTPNISKTTDLLSTTQTRKKSFKHSLPLGWKDRYSKRFICRFCNKQVKTKSSLKRHLNVHDGLYSRYADIIRKTCTVTLVKSDGLPNASGNLNTVMLNPSKIISQETIKSISYCVLYLPKKSSNTNDNDNTCDKSDSQSDYENFNVNPVKRKRRRLLSTDTVVLGKDIKKPKSYDDEENLIAAQRDQELECINIDDSSNGSSIYNNTVDISDVKSKDFGLREVQHILNVCYKKCSKKYDLSATLPVNIDQGHLKHKILSIGRKIITKETMSCIGILRYLECKNLEIKWKVNTNEKVDNYVHVMPRLKLSEDVDPLEANWKNMVELGAKVNNETLHTPPETSKYIQNHIENDAACLTKNKTLNEHMKENKFPVLYSYVESDKKLLNASPVANPKQLPKKFNATDSKNSSAVMWLQTEKNQDNGMDTAEQDQQSDNNMPLPIITSTSSLVGNFTKDNDNEASTDMCLPMITSTTSLAIPTAQSNVIIDNMDTNKTEDNEKSQPRIKVKPASELMSDRALKSLTQQQVDPPAKVWNQTVSVVPITQSTVIMGTSTQITPAILPQNAVTLIPVYFPNTASVPAQNENGKVILDTVELPNTLTDSPFRYLKNLLQIHAITLLDTNNPVLSNFTCLIKFKLQFSRDSVNQPITLCLSVHCKENIFFLGVKDPNQAYNIDLNKLSANWQWEILKTYTTRKAVINKILLNARKVSGELYNNTERFLNVIKSINFKSIK